MRLACVCVPGKAGVVCWDWRPGVNRASCGCWCWLVAIGVGDPKRLISTATCPSLRAENGAGTKAPPLVPMLGESSGAGGGWCGCAVGWSSKSEGDASMVPVCVVVDSS